MTDPLSEFDARMDTVMAQAASFDADVIAEAQKAVSQWVQGIEQGSLDAEQLDKVRARLCVYRDLCAFLQGTLNQALKNAGRIEGAGYTGSGPLAAWAQPLMRRYG